MCPDYADADTFDSLDTEFLQLKFVLILTIVFWNAGKSGCSWNAGNPRDAWRAGDAGSARNARITRRFRQRIRSIRKKRIQRRSRHPKFQSIARHRRGWTARLSGKFQWQTR